MSKKLTNWELVKDITLDLESKQQHITTAQVEDIFTNKYPSRNVKNVKFELKLLSVNSNARLSYLKLKGYIGNGEKLYSPSIEDPRLSNPNNPKDLLFYHQSSKYYERYDPIKHGYYEIKCDHNMRNSIVQISEYMGNEKAFNLDVQEALKLTNIERRNKIIDTSTLEPEYTFIKVKQFKRSSYITAERLKKANGRCEKCSNKAPFKRISDGTPYLEVHHIIPLANKGADTLDNTIALCPNCHREYHYG